MATNYLLFEQIERIGNLLRSEGRQFGQEHGLQPVHWQALAYLARCNPISNTPMALSQFLGISKGTTSQSVLVLHNKGFIEKVPDRHDRRMVHLQLTPAGRTLLARAYYLPLLEQFDAGIADHDREQTSRVLAQLLKTMLEQQQGKSFGVCRSCRYFDQQGDHYHCQLIDVPIEAREIDNICHEHRYP